MSLSICSSSSQSLVYQPIVNLTPEPTEAVASDPAEAVASDPAEAVASDPTEAVDSDPTEAVDSDPTEAVDSDPTEAVDSDPTEAVDSDPTEAVASDPAEAVASDPAEAEKLELARTAASHFCLPEFGGAINSGSSLSSLLQSHTVNTLAYIANEDSRFFPFLVLAGIFHPDNVIRLIFSDFAQPQALKLQPDQCKSFVDVVDYEKFKALDGFDFRDRAVSYCFNRVVARSFRQRNALKLYVFLDHIIKTASSLGYADIFESARVMLPVIRYNDFNLLERTPLDLGVCDTSTVALHSYRTAIRQFSRLLNEVEFLSIFLEVERVTIPSALNKPGGLRAYLLPLHSHLMSQIDSNSKLSPEVKRNLKSAICHRMDRLSMTDFDLEMVKMRGFDLGRLTFYQQVIYSDTARQIAAMPRGSSKGTKDLVKPEEMDLSDASYIDREYATRNRQIYEDVIPRFYEIIDYFSTTCAEAINDLKTLRWMCFFLKIGDVDDLVNKLTLAKANPEKIDAAITGVINKFFEKMNNPDSHQVLSKLIDEERQTIGSLQMINYFNSLWNKWTEFPQMLESLLRPQLKQAEKALPHLFIGEPFSAPRRVKRREVNRRATTTSSSSSSSSSSLPPVTSEPDPLLPMKGASKASSSSAPPIPSFSSQIQSSRAQLQKLATGLCAGRHDLTQQAIKDGFMHFDDLICSLRHLHCHLDTPLTAEKLHAFIGDCIYHCTLGVEQLLSALDRDSNQVTTLAQLQPRLTHRLFTILQSIKMGDGDLSPRVRRWIREISGGEILTRDFKDLDVNKTVLNQLLLADYLCLTGQEGASVARVFDSLSLYLAPIGEFLDTIQDRFKTGKKFKPIELEENFSQMCTTFCRTLASRSLSSSSEKSAISPVSELRRHLGELQSAEPSATSYTLENIRNNLLISLQEKVDALMSIEPIDSSSKLGGVLYTCQVIAEYVLINAREMKGFPISLEEGNQHNLMAHVEKLGIRGSFSKEELDFLTRGKSTRQMIRYPESYAKQNAPLVLQQSSRGRARRGGKGQPQVSSRSSAPMPSRCETMQKMLEWGRSLSREQSAADDLRGFRSADAGQAKKLEEIKKFALAEVALLSSIVKKVLVSCR